MSLEPLHNSRREAIDWVTTNTDNTLWQSSHSDDHQVIRVDARGQVMLLRQAATEGAPWYWDSLREWR